jgi:basic membrane protein A
MNRKTILFLLATTLLGLSSCTSSPDCSSEKIICAALVTDTLGINDYGLNHEAWLGLQQARDENLANHIAYIETVDPRDGEKNIAKFARDGYDVIVTVGMGLRGETLRYADLYPDSVFIGIDQADTESRRNLISITFPEDQSGFLAGALAAQLTQTKVIGAACETSGLDPMWRYCEGFRKGALYIDKDIKIFVNYRNNGSREKLFIDDKWGYSTAQEMIQNGADVIFAAGGGTGQGALRAAADEHVLAIGAERDQAQVLSESASGIVTSFYGRASYSVREVMRKLGAGQEVAGALQGPIGFAPYNPNIRISDEIQQKMNALLSDLAARVVLTAVTNSAP